MTIVLLLLLLLLVIVTTALDYHKSISENNSVLISFSAIRTIRSLFSDANPVDKNLNILNGVRVISILWVILGHTYINTQTIIAPNSFQATYFMTEPTWFAIMSGATLAVDTFFGIGGFLTGLSNAKTFEN